MFGGVEAHGTQGSNLRVLHHCPHFLSLCVPMPPVWARDLHGKRHGYTWSTVRGSLHVARAISISGLLLFELVRRSEGVTVSLTSFSLTFAIPSPPPPALKKGRLSGFVETFYVLIVGVVKRGWYIIWQNSSNTTVQICMYKLHLN